MFRIEGATLGEKALIRKVEKACLKHLGQSDIFLIDLCITSADEIRSLNASARKIDKVTDVLSFPNFDKLSLPVTKDDFSDCDFEGKRVLLGSIMICRERATEQAKEYGHSYARELGFLSCHGMLHLLGFDHVEKDDEEIMTAHQRAVMDLAKLKR